LGGLAKDIGATLALDRFTAESRFDARFAIGGARSADPKKPAMTGGLEALSERVHLVLGRDGDLGSPATAARDPVFWLHCANIDRLWVKWTDPARGRIPPVDDDGWMKTKFTFVDENGDDRVMTGAEVLDTQHQLGYRYDDDPPRAERLVMQPADTVRAAPPDEIVLARGPGVELTARESHLVLAAVPRPPARYVPKGQQKAKAPTPRPRMHIVLKDVVASDRTPPYDVSLVLEGPNVFDPTTTTAELGAMEFFGERGAQNDDDEDVAFDATEAIAKLSKVRGYNIRHLRVTIVRRADGQGNVPRDPSPPRIGAIELVQS
jgi:tyrosinase